MEYSFIYNFLLYCCWSIILKLVSISEHLTTFPITFSTAHMGIINIKDVVWYALYDKYKGNRMRCIRGNNYSSLCVHSLWLAQWS